MKDFQDYYELLNKFKKDVELYTQQGYCGTKFNNSLKLNSPFYIEAFNTNIEILPQVFERLFDITKNHKTPAGFLSLNQYQINKEAFFEEEDIAYLDEFEIEHKYIFEYLLLMRPDRKKPTLETKEEKKQYWKNIESTDERRRYFWKFLKTVTFLCAFYEYKLVVSKDPKLIVEKQNDQDKTHDPHQEYYLFYNRSHIEKAGIGIGKVTIINTKAIVEYYYSVNDEEAILLGKEYKTLRITGRIEPYDDSDILVLKNLLDEKNSKGTFKGPVESFFVLKRYRKPKEKILLGINCSWNRSHHFPYATALLLIDKTYYDNRFGNNKLYIFESLKRNRQYVPQEIYYYLFHQSISLQDVIDNNKDNTTKKDALPFTEFSQIPFSDEIPYLNYVIGKYQGYTIIFNDQREYLQISQMEIFANGVVKLIINEEDKDTSNDVRNKGYIKNVNIDSDRGKLYINLRYNYGKHFNSLNIFLEFNKVDRTKPTATREKLVLMGGYAGESTLTKRPISATVIFEEVDNHQNIVAGRIPILTKERNFNPDIEALYKDNKSLFDFFINDNYSLFANDQGINLLKKRFANTDVSVPQLTKINRYDVFISIPLTQNGDEETYNRNCRIALELRDELSMRYGFSKNRIYCACFFREGYYTYKDYTEAISIPKRIFEKVRDCMDNSDAIFFVYPCSDIIDSVAYRISSSIIEIGYAMGRNKKIVVLYEKNEINRLPKNMIMLNADNIYSFETSKETPIKGMFESRDNQDEIRNILGLT